MSFYSDMREINNREILPKETNANQVCWRSTTIKEERIDSLMATNGNMTNSNSITNKPVDSTPDDQLRKVTSEENDVADYEGSGAQDASAEQLTVEGDQSASIGQIQADQVFGNDEDGDNFDKLSPNKDEIMDDVDDEEAYEENPKLVSSLENDHEDNFEDEAYDAQDDNDNDIPKTNQHNGDNYDDEPVPSNSVDIPDENMEQFASKPDIWTLPAKREDCSLEEIRRGQVINNIAPNECPVIGCGKKINENRIEPSPGTIASGLRTHVLFVHYENRRANKKRKLGWSTKRKSQASPRKQSSQILSPSTSAHDYESEIQASNPSNLGLNLMKNSNSPHNYPRYQSTSVPGSIINKKVKQLAAKQSLQMSSLQSLMQATGSNVINLGSQTQTNSKPKVLETNNSQTENNNNLNPTTSSLFSILAGLTQPQLNQQAPISKNIKTAHGTNTINITSCSRNSVNNITNNNINSNKNSTSNNRPAVNSSLLSLLNEKISGNVASSLQSQLKKTLAGDARAKINTPTFRQKNSTSVNNSYYQANNDPNYNNSSSILNSLCSGNGDSRIQYDNSIPLNSFIESVAIKTGSNIGLSGIVEAKKIIEKFTISLICSSQTIADHYLAPFSGDVPQQKPEISPSDVMLAYKMMYKSHSQP